VLGHYNKALALKPDDIETLLRIGNLLRRAETV